MFRSTLSPISQPKLERLQAKILIPLVTSIAFGLMSTTLLIILVVPASYANLNDFGLTSLAAGRRQAAA